MRTYPAENWKLLGQAVHDLRLGAGFASMKDWAEAVGRSTRQLQGLERGEKVGEGTLIEVARVLGLELGALVDVLASGVEVRPGSEWIPASRLEAGLSELRSLLGMGIDDDARERAAALGDLISLVPRTRRDEAVQRAAHAILKVIMSPEQVALADDLREGLADGWRGWGPEPGALWDDGSPVDPDTEGAAQAPTEVTAIRPSRRGPERMDPAEDSIHGHEPPMDAAAHRTGEESGKERMMREQDEAAENQD